MSDPVEHRLLPTDYFRPLRREEIFGSEGGEGRPLEIDLGCGDGTFTQEMAAHFPERDFLAVERLKGRVEKVCRKAARGGLANLKVLRLESAYTVGYLLPDALVSRLHLLFPDPWPKAKHHKNRLFRNADFQDGLARCLQPEGEFLLKTDHLEYWEEAVEVLDGLPFLTRRDWDDGDFYPHTDFEEQWLAEGRSVHRARWARS